MVARGTAALGQPVVMENRSGADLEPSA